MIEIIIFNLLAFTLFIFIFLKMIIKNDTSYLVLLVIQVIGITINFISLICSKELTLLLHILIYLLSVLLPLIILGIEWRGFNFAECLQIAKAKISFVLGDTATAKKHLEKLINKYPQSYLGHKFLAEILVKEGEKEKGIEEYVTAIDINKKDYQSYFVISDLLKQCGRQSEAALMLDNLLELKPDYTKASLLLRRNPV